MKRFFRAFMACLTIAQMGLASFSAQADVVPTNISYLFSGNCTDCANAAGTDSFAVTGTLVLKAGDYSTNPNQKVGTEYFVSFTYNGSNLLDAFTIFAGDNVNFFYASGSNYFDITEQLDAEHYRFFWSDTEGNWSTGLGQIASDIGNGATLTLFNTVPEPATILLLGATLAGLGLSRRRRQV